MEFDEELYLALSRDMEGVCRACGEIQSNVEPDAEGYACECCGRHEVVGADIYLFEAA